jgi:hypothetical protein
MSEIDKVIQKYQKSYEDEIDSIFNQFQIDLEKRLQSSPEDSPQLKTPSPGSLGGEKGSFSKFDSDEELHPASDDSDSEDMRPTPRGNIPKWSDTWKYQGLKGLGQRIWRGVRPEEDIAWRYANESERRRSTLQEYLSYKIYLESQVDNYFVLEESIEIRDLVDRLKKDVVAALSKYTTAIHNDLKIPMKVPTPSIPIASSDPDKNPFSSKGKLPIGDDSEQGEPDVPMEPDEPPTSPRGEFLFPDMEGEERTKKTSDEEDEDEPTKFNDPRQRMLDFDSKPSFDEYAQKRDLLKQKLGSSISEKVVKRAINKNWFEWPKSKDDWDRNGKPTSQIAQKLNSDIASLKDLWATIISGAFGPEGRDTLPDDGKNLPSKNSKFWKIIKNKLGLKKIKHKLGDMNKANIFKYFEENGYANNLDVLDAELKQYASDIQDEMNIPETPSKPLIAQDADVNVEEDDFEISNPISVKGLSNDLPALRKKKKRRDELEDLLAQMEERPSSASDDEPQDIANIEPESEEEEGSEDWEKYLQDNPDPDSEFQSLDDLEDDTLGDEEEDDEYIRRRA